MASNSTGAEKLNKSLTPTQVWALALGSIVGWGCFVLPGDMFLPQAGPLATLIAFYLGALLLGFVAVTYGYMIEYTPVAGGEYAYAFVGFGPRAAFICGWALVLGYVAIIAINVSALALIVRFLLPGVFEVGELYSIAGWKVYAGEVGLMCGATLFFGIMNYRGISMAGAVQIALAFCLTVGVLLLFGGTVAMDGVSLDNLTPLFAENRPAVASIVAIFAISPFLFVGFDTVPQAAEEFSFSPKKARNLMLAAIFWGAVLYSLVTLAVALAMPYPELLAKMEAMRAGGLTAWATGEVSRMAFGKWGAIVLASAVLGAVCTGINGFYVATTRLILSMARGGILPAWFAEIHPKYQSPHKAVLFTIGIVLISPWCGRAVVGWIVDMSAVGTAVAYLYTCLAAGRVVRGTPGIPGAGTKRLIASVGALTAVLCLALLLLPFSPAFIGPAPRIVMGAWVGLGCVFYLMTRKDWINLPDRDLRARILNDPDLPVFYGGETTVSGKAAASRTENAAA